jgi:membrane protein DedA with SNARE-associated domain
MLLESAPGGLIASLWRFVQQYPDEVVFSLLVLCGVGLPVPEEPILLMAGAVVVELAALPEAPAHQFLLVRMTVVCAVGILLGDLLCFHLGRRMGRNILHFPFVKGIATRPRRVRAERFFQRYGTWSIFIARFFAGVRLVMYFSAGASHRVSAARFLLMDFLGVLVSVPISVWLGYLAFKELSNWEAAKSKLGVFHGILMAAIAVGLVVWFVLARKKRAADRSEAKVVPRD